MESDASDNYEDLYTEEDASKHDKLVQKVLSLNKTQQLKKPSRTEPTLQISEFNLVKSITGNKGAVHLNDLAKSLKDRKSRLKISENVRKIQRQSHTLPKPLEKPQANRIRRSVAYEKTRLKLDRWEATVTANRVSTNLSFPLNNDFKLEKKESEKFPTMWRVKSSLQQELEKIEPKTEEFHIDLEQEKFPLTMKEMLVRRQEAAKLRAYQGYKEAKARRQNKIKSKKYHRIQKRERIKKQLKEFEQLQKTNPEEALKKLEEIEKSRIEERFSLRHKSTGKWAKNQQIRAKYDKESRQVLAQQLTLSRELTQKLKTNSDSEDDEAEEKVPDVVDENNPWVNGIKPEKEVADFISGYRKYWMEKNKEEGQTEQLQQDMSEETTTFNKETVPKKKKETREKNEEEGKIEQQDISEETPTVNETKVSKKKKESKASPKKNSSENLNKTMSTSEWEISVVENTADVENMFNKFENKLHRKMLRSVKKLKNKLNKKDKANKESKREIVDNKIDLTLNPQKKIPIIDEELIENPNSNSENVQNNENLSDLRNIAFKELNQNESNIDPDKYLKIKPTNLSTAIPDILTEDNEEPTQREIISEAFEDDDIVQEFAKEKQDEIDRDKPKDVDLSLPGWGSWGGTNIKISKRKKRRFTIKAPPKVPRRDDNKGALIINEKAQNKIKEHMVSEVPFPFKTVKDFEASMRAPISNTFVPETAYRRLIKPAVTTQMGSIIEPISKNILLNKNN
ncbi:U3 small nucleolar RNA-associated protein 14 homolog A [Tribolium madens]|uniref:U3 small nucleolar RNA-associated protein 14 homolog A n=1 Tax=Tribolium madens TaxID=41895 RepID=UPI001CF741B7|nr:U3 small nucleolar RNA-associated protein 14 homolog A [Tribolium madens]